MKQLILLSVLLLGGCSFFGNTGQNPLDKLQGDIGSNLSADLTTTGKIGDIVKRPEISQCTNYLNGLLASNGGCSDMIKALQAIDTTHQPIASAFKDVFLLDAQRSCGSGIQADFQKNFPIQCGAMQSVFNQKVLEWMIYAQSRGQGKIPAPLVGQ